MSCQTSIWHVLIVDTTIKFVQQRDCSSFEVSMLVITKVGECTSVYLH